MGDSYYIGEMAADALKVAMGTEDLLIEYHTGRMSDAKAYELGLIDELGHEYNPRNYGKTCRCCGDKGLNWRQVNGKWLLHEGTTLHNCKVNPYMPL